MKNLKFYKGITLFLLVSILIVLLWGFLDLHRWNTKKQIWAEKAEASSSQALWVCQNPFRFRKGVAFTIQNCANPCDKYHKNPICCDLEYVRQNNCSLENRLEDFACSLSMLPPSNC